MRHPTRIRIAVVSTALFLGGLAAAGMGFRAAHDSGPQSVTAHPRTEVIHETRIRTVHVPPRRTKARATRPTQPVSQLRVPASAPAEVRSRVSPTRGERAEDEGAAGEAFDD